MATAAEGGSRAATLPWTPRTPPASALVRRGRRPRRRRRRRRGPSARPSSRYKAPSDATAAAVSPRGAVVRAAAAERGSPAQRGSIASPPENPGSTCSRASLLAGATTLATAVVARRRRRRRLAPRPTSLASRSRLRGTLSVKRCAAPPPHPAPGSHRSSAPRDRAAPPGAAAHRRLTTTRRVICSLWWRRKRPRTPSPITRAAAAACVACDTSPRVRTAPSRATLAPAHTRCRCWSRPSAAVRGWRRIPWSGGQSAMGSLAWPVCPIARIGRVAHIGMLARLIRLMRVAHTHTGRANRTRTYVSSRLPSLTLSCVPARLRLAFAAATATMPPSPRGGALPPTPRAAAVHKPVAKELSDVTYLASIKVKVGEMGKSLEEGGAPSWESTPHAACARSNSFATSRPELLLPDPLLTRQAQQGRPHLPPHTRPPRALPAPYPRLPRARQCALSRSPRRASTRARRRRS